MYDGDGGMCGMLLVTHDNHEFQYTVNVRFTNIQNYCTFSQDYPLIQFDIIMLHVHKWPPLMCQLRVAYCWLSGGV